MELATIILLILTVLLLVASLVVGIVNISVLKKKRRGGIDGGDILDEIDVLSNNLNEVMNLINEHTTKEKDNLAANLTSTINASNQALAPMLELYMNNFKDVLGENLKATKETLEEIRREMREATANMSRGTAESLNSMKKDTSEALDRMSKSNENTLDRIGNSLKESLKEVRDDNKNQLDRMQKGNEEQLEKMRQTVDEKLTSTLNSRISSAFEVVQKSIDSVQQGFGEMKELTGKVGNLNKMFANVKTRGGWGEVALESLLDQILSPEQYKRQFRLDKTSKEMVDFVIVMPGQNGTELYLPIDCKFPLDRYVELVEASDSGDLARIDAARKELVSQIKKEAKSISQKYIKEEVTTSFAVMYLPSEGLYAEIAKDSALTTQLQNEFNVTVCGPTTITALLNSLQVGFTTLKIQKQSGEIAKTLKQFKNDFKVYSNLVTQVKGQAEAVVRNISRIEDQNKKIKDGLESAGGELTASQEQKLVAADTYSDSDGTDGEVGV